MDSTILIAGRYRLERLAGAGGMGSVYQAVDLKDDRAVAVKLAQHLSDHNQARRFIREAQVLAGLDHPHIVKYIDHGVTMAGAPFLVMEWLEGQDLAQTLEREPLTEAQTITLGRNVCSALTAAHARGIIHRDLKPGNLFLVGGGAERVKLIDFGVVRRQVAMSMPTKPGMLIGTPGFIAPEQARGEPLIDQRADLYSLGAVMFACLTARPPFEGHQLMAVLAKLLIDPAPRVTELRRDVSMALDELIARLLAKHADDRPDTADEVAALLEQVARTDRTAPRRAHSAPLSHREQRVFSVLLLGDTARPHNPQARKSLTSLAETFNADLQQLMDGSMMAVFSTDYEPGEMATRAARCALAFHGRSPGAPIVVATGRGLLEESAPVGRVIDDAVSLLFAFDQTQDLDVSFTATAVAPEIIIDEATAALIANRFELAPSPESRGRVLIGEAAALSGARKLLGKETRLVGRDRELARLETIFEQCLIERTPRVVVIEGQAGAGKSRLAHEFIKGLRQSGRQLAIWSAHGESIRKESPLGAVAELLRQAMQIPATAALAAQRQRICQCVAERVAPEQLHRVAPFLGEIMGVRFADSDHVQLHEARRDPGIMRDLMQQAWDEFLAAEADGWPVILVLEDQQWIDRASLRFIDMALRSLDTRAVLVLAMALPDCGERMAGLWSGHAIDRITLGPLSQRACVELARQVLPEPVHTDAVTGLVERSGGNPFYLEELLRGTAGQPADHLPDTILVMVSARLGALTPGERRALRAASVFGADFWVAGVAALLDDEPAEVSAIINHLCDREFVVSRSRSRFEGQAQYGFHHDLLRDAAYALLTDEDRIHAHRGAGEWFEDMGESDAAILAEHYWRGKAFASALPWYRRAAEHALGAEDLDSVIHLAQRAVDCGAGGEVLGALKALQAEARNWMMQPELAVQLGIDAMKRLSEGGDAWAGAGQQVIWAASSLSDVDQMVHTARQLIEHIPDRPSDEYLASLASPALHLRMHQRTSESRVVVGVLRAHLRTRTPGPLLAATLANMNGVLLGFDGKLDLALTVMKLSVELWTELGSLRHVCLDQGNMGEILCALGQYQDGIDELWRSVIQSRRADFKAVRTWYESALALALARTGALDEAGRLFESLSETRQGGSLDTFRQVCRAQFELLAGQPERAYQHVSGLLDPLAGAVLPNQQVLARAVAARALLALGRPRQALDEARAGLAAIGSFKGFTGEGEVPIRLAYAEALHACGHEPEACGAIAEARRRLLERAELITNLDMRQSFLDRVADNRRTLELAAAWQEGR